MIKRLSAIAVLLLCACQPRASRLLLLDMTLSDPGVLESTAAPWHAAGYTVEYRRTYPHLTREDLRRYRTLVLLGGREPETVSDGLTLGDLAILAEWVRGGGVVVLAYAGDGEGLRDRWIMNRWLAAQGAGVVIGDYALEDTTAQPGVLPLPQSSLDGAGFAPFPAGRNHPLEVRRASQVLARTTATAFVRPPREAPSAQGGAPVIAASRVDDGLVVVLSRHALAALGVDVRATTLPPIVPADALGRTRLFLAALARWTRRDAEWAGVAPAEDETPLSLAGAPPGRPVAPHAPPLAAPRGADVVGLPLPAGETDGAAVGGWIGRQGMRVLWSAPGQRPLEATLTFAEVGALNALATEVQAPARADSLGLRNVWRPTVQRLRATSVRWFPAIVLRDLGPAGAPPELDLHGDAAPVVCALDSTLWRGALQPAYRALARLATAPTRRGGRGAGGGGAGDLVDGVALDLDLPRGGYAGAGFCDATFREGVRALGMDSAETERLTAIPAAARYDTLLERGVLARYYDALERLVAERAAALRAELRRANPDLRFAIRRADAPDDWFTLGLMRGFSTADAPVLLWTRERSLRALLGRYRGRGIFVVSAIALAPERVGAGDWPRLRRLAFVEHSGFWIPSADGDSVGRLIRRLAR